MSKEFAAALASSDTVAVIGVGNVALDCARILAKGEKSLATSECRLSVLNARTAVHSVFVLRSTVFDPHLFGRFPKREIWTATRVRVFKKVK